MRYFVIKIKDYTLPIIFILFTLCLVIFSSSNLVAAKNGLNLWATSVIPSLFPFFIAVELLSKTNIPYVLGKLFNPLMKPLFNIRGEGSFALIMGIISGYPTGANIACNFRKNNILSKIECERLLSFTNNSGPLFILGSVGISMFGNSTIGILLLITHILACLSVGLIFRFWNPKSSQNNDYFSSDRYGGSVSFSSLGEILSESIKNATSTILMIGGFVVLFSVIISILKTSHFLATVCSIINPLLDVLKFPTTLTSPFITGILEITNGISLISGIHLKAISLNIILSAFLLGFGGISVLLQVLSIISKSDLSIKPYIIGKLLHGTIAAFYSFLFMQFVPMFNFNL